MKKSIKKIALLTSICAFTLIGFSNAVYGRFTRQFNPEISSFGVTIASHENILISTSGDPNTFHDSIKLGDLVDDTEVSLSPLTGKVTQTPDGAYQPFTLTDDDGNEASENKYLAFDLYFIGSTDMNLYLKGSAGGTVADFDDSDADYQFSQEDRDKLLNSLRVGFLTYSTTYQPSGTGTTIVYSDSPIATNIYSKNVVSSDNYTTFNRLGFSNTANDRILAQTVKNEVTKVRVIIWMEKESIGDLEAICNLTLHLRFEAVIRES